MLAKGTELNLTDEQMLQIIAALDDDSKDLPIGEEFHIHVKADNLSAVEDQDEEWMNILLLGTDTGYINLKTTAGRTP